MDTAVDGQGKYAECQLVCSFIYNSPTLGEIYDGLVQVFATSEEGSRTTPNWNLLEQTAVNSLDGPVILTGEGRVI